jgi:hypothetical protein
VISTTSTGTATDLEKWFNRRSKSISIGNFDISGSRLYFSTTEPGGTVVYDGVITGNYYLVLTSTSLINGYSTKETYYFIKIPSLH